MDTKQVAAGHTRRQSLEAVIIRACACGARMTDGAGAQLAHCASCGAPAQPPEDLGEIWSKEIAL